MDYDGFIEIIRRESEAMAVAAASLAPEAPVPSCPGWDVAALVSHIGIVQNWAALTVATRATERLPRTAAASPPEDRALLVGWFRDATRALVTTLSSTDPSTPVWSWVSPGIAAYWARRQAHEVAVHRWDAEDAAGAARPIDAAVAADGVSELLELAPARGAELFAGRGESLHFHATDVPGEWLVRLSPSGLEVRNEHAKGDVAARGTASDLDLFLWGRKTADVLEVFGDRELLLRFQKLTAL